MSDSPKDIERDAEILSQACREVRAAPGRFVSGLAHIERMFSVETLRSEAQRHLDEIDREYPNGRPPIGSAYQRDLESASHPMIRLRRLKEWASQQNLAMGSEEAQAVLLVAALAYDHEPDWQNGLPRLLDAWVTEFWQGENANSVRDQVASQRGVLRMIRYEIAYFTEFRSQIAHAARLAWERAGISSGTPNGAGRPSDETVADLPVLTLQEVLFVRVLIASDPMVWVSSKEWCDRYDAKRRGALPGAPAESDFRSRIVPRIKPWGLDSEKRGFRFPAGVVARDYFGTSS